MCRDVEDAVAAGPGRARDREVAAFVDGAALGGSVTLRSPSVGRHSGRDS